MILLNPQYFSAIKEGKTYSINHQYLINTKIPQPRKDELLSRVGCMMVAKKKTIVGTFPARDTILMECTGSSARCRRQQHKRLQLTRLDINPTMVSTAGSLIVRVFSDVCHACGSFKDDCWRDWVGHLICNNCRLLGRHRPPYDYGAAAPRCCNKYVCGSKQDRIGDEKDLVLYDKVVKIYERHRW